MLPGNKFTPDDLLSIFRRRFWLLAVPFAIVSAATAMFARQLPDRFKSEAVILLVPQQVPQTIVRAPVTTALADRLPALQQQILSRTRLEPVILEFNLYPEARKGGIMEDVIQTMRLRDIKISPVRSDTFRISYESPGRMTAMRVTERLASFIIDLSASDRTQLTEQTDVFLETEIATAKKSLLENEAKLTEYRLKHAGELPTQLGANISALQATTSNMQRYADSINIDKSRRLMLEGQLATLQEEAINAIEAVLPTGTGTPTPTPVSSTEQLLDAAQKSLANLQQRYSDLHPDVKLMKQQVVDLRAKLDAELNERPVSAAAAPATPQDKREQARLDAIKSLKNQIELIDKQVAAKESDQKNLQAQAMELGQKIAATPIREAEMVDLVRDTPTIQSNYYSLLNRKAESNLSAQLERKQGGERFQLLDQAKIPDKPISPDRPQINVIGMGAGLTIGLALIAFVEFRDATFKTDDEVTRLLELPVLAVVPLMQTDEERRRSLRWRLIIWAGLGSVVAGCMALVMYTFVY